MKSIVIEKTYSTPEVNFDFDKGLLSLRGRSIPEDSIGFYEPLLNSITEYSKNPLKNTIVNIQLEYFNTNSARSIYDLLNRLDKINNTHNLVINWYYDSDDDDMREVGEDLQKMLKTNFNIIPVEEE